MTTVRTRREPPAFQRMEVADVEPVTPRMVRVTFTGALRVDEPAASVRVLLPSPGAAELVVPTWSGNEFLLPDGSRPVIRTFTPHAGERLAIDVVLHGHGAASTWAANAQPGAPLAVSGPGKGYVIDPAAAAFVLAGDETAIPAIGQLLTAIPPDTPTQAFVETASTEARHDDMPTVTWLEPGHTMVDAIKEADIPEGAHVWAAGEAAAVQAVRRHLYDERGIPRSQCSISGYWKQRQAG